MIDSLKQRLHARSGAMLLSIESRLDRIMLGWILLAGFASAVRIAASPMYGTADLATIAPYVLLIVAPVASMALALRWFRDGDRLPQPGLRLARLGRWRSLVRNDATRLPLYGAGGIMLSLLIGMLLNVPVRAAEYFAAMPALAGSVPPWLTVLHTLMTIDVVLLTSLYTIAFVAALRHVPLFPRMLGAIWSVDLAMQLVTAELVARTPDLPQPVATALRSLIEGNVQKVLISIALWLPYLLMSKRVNLTYRLRLPA